MMTYSMTAFASSELKFENLILHCELRSVNHRYCDISLKIAERFRFIETDARRLVAQKLKRGKIECSLSYKKQLSTDEGLSVDMEAVQALLKSTDAIEKLMMAPQSFSALDILNYPNIQIEPSTDKQALKQSLSILISETLEGLINARAREGAELQQLISLRCHKMQACVEQAKVRLPLVLKKIRTKLIAQIEELVAAPDYERIEQELVIFAQKLDVDEEIDRLDTHINEVLAILERDEPIGRRLDFLMQEMNREANTLGSKSADKAMTAIAIELKVLIEQMREQVQNIE